MIGRPRGLGLLIPALLAASCAAPALESAERETVPGTTTGACADLVVLGARGSTQDPTLNAGLGTEVRRTTEALVRRLHDRSETSVHVEAVRYDAAQATTLAAYQQHTADGSRMMTERLDRLASACPDSRFALIGFSQGAQVVHGAATDVPAPLAGRIVLAAMIADPLTNPADAIARWSYANQPTTGNGRLGSGPPIDADLRRAAISLCVADDEICNDRGAPGGPPSDTHKRFYERPTAVTATAARLDRVLRANGV